MSNNYFYSGYMFKGAEEQTIEFPLREVADLKHRLIDNKPIYTTRIDAEKGKYKLNERLFAKDLETYLKVQNINTYKDITEHPFLSELTPEQKKEIDKFPYEVLKLEKEPTNVSQEVSDIRYERPYPMKLLPEYLRIDPVHRWRAETGLELIHKEPTLDELKRIIANWEYMSPAQKKLSDEKSVELFGVDNSTHVKQLLKRVLKKKENKVE